MPNAAPNALVKRKTDMTNDFIDTGAFVQAYSRPLMLANISEANREVCGFLDSNVDLVVDCTVITAGTF